jgi:hypothetical protein
MNKVKVETKTRQPNIFSVMFERDPVTGNFSVIGHQAKRLMHKNQHASSAEWMNVAPRDIARALRNNKIVAA